MSRPPEDQPFDQPSDQPPSYGTPPPSPDVPPPGYAPTPSDAPVPGSAPGHGNAPGYGDPSPFGSPPPEHRPYAVGDPTGSRRPGPRIRLATSLVPLLVAVLLFLLMRGNGSGTIWLPFILIAGVGLVMQIVRRRSYRD